MNNVAVLIDARATTDGPERPGSLASTWWRVSLSGQGHARSFQQDHDYCGSRTDEYVEASRVRYCYTMHPETGSKPSMIDLINWGD